MTIEEMKEKISCIRQQGFWTEDDKHIIWDIHKQTLGQFHGNLGCVDCIREAIRKLTIYFETIC